MASPTCQPNGRTLRQHVQQTVESILEINTHINNVFPDRTRPVCRSAFGIGVAVSSFVDIMMFASLCVEASGPAALMKNLRSRSASTLVGIFLFSRDGWLSWGTVRSLSVQMCQHLVALPAW